MYVIILVPRFNRNVAARVYISVFRDSQILEIHRSGDDGREVHGMETGAVMTITFELDEQRFTALNGAPIFAFNEAIAVKIDCATQGDVGYYFGCPTAETPRFSCSEPAVR